MHNPGSAEAMLEGCTCPTIDNHHGWGCRWGENVFIYSCDCPYHNEEKEEDNMVDTFVYNMIAELQDNVLSTIQLIPMDDEYSDVTEALHEINIMFDDILVELEEEI